MGNKDCCRLSARLGGSMLCCAPIMRVLESRRPLRVVHVVESRAKCIHNNFFSFLACSTQWKENGYQSPRTQTSRTSRPPVHESYNLGPCDTDKLASPRLSTPLVPSPAPALPSFQVPYIYISTPPDMGYKKEALEPKRCYATQLFLPRPRPIK